MMRNAYVRITLLVDAIEMQRIILRICTQANEKKKQIGKLCYQDIHTLYFLQR